MTVPRLRPVQSLPVEGRRILLRADLNVPVEAGQVAEDLRIRAALPTLAHLRERGAAVLVAAHLGRPGGEPDPRFSLAPVAARLGELLDRDVPLACDCIGESARALARDLAPGEVGMLENTRFDPREKRDDDAFARALADLAEGFVNDAFGAVHRAHASVVGVTRHLPSAAGLLVQREVEALGRVVEAPERPYVVILGGAKVADKLPLVEHLLEQADRIFVGGAIANTFLRAAGHETGDSLVEAAVLDAAARVLTRAGDALLLPADLRIARGSGADAEIREIPAGDVPAGFRIVDIGPAALDALEALLDGARTVFWNGPLGQFEIEAFAAGTRSTATMVAGSGAYSIVGGGETLAAVRSAGVATRISHLSTGGGAALAFLRGDSLPGLAALRED